jgi:hypothetical protein
MPIYEIKHFSGGLSDWEDRGVTGAFKFGKNLDIRKQIDSLTCAQDLEGESYTQSFCFCLAFCVYFTFPISDAIKKRFSLSVCERRV